MVPFNESPPFEKVYKLVSAFLHPQSVKIKLSQAFLLKGNRGVGKATAVRTIGNMLGMHVLEVILSPVYLSPRFSYSFYPGQRL